METTIFAGKGGVGKSTCAAAYALHQAGSCRVNIINFDGGHAIPRVLALNGQKLPYNRSACTGIDNLSVALAAPLGFTPISNIDRRDDACIERYFSQFKGDLGLVPYCDMAATYLGLPLDMKYISKFASLVELFHNAKIEDAENIVVDVEATAGLESMLSSVELMTARIKSLRDSNWAKLRAMAVAYPAASAFLKSEYIENFNVYAERLAEVSAAIKEADYFVVCIPEESPVEEMRQIVMVLRGFGGKVRGYVINNIRGEPHEGEQMIKIRSGANGHRIVEIPHCIGLCANDTAARIAELRGVGEKLARG